MMQNNVNTIDKNSREYQQNLYNGSRHNLLMVLIFTVINLFSLVTGGSSYWLFSASIPYYLTAFGMMFDAFPSSIEPVIGTFTIIALVISAVILAVYLVCWILSKKYVGLMITALVLFALDTLAFVALVFLLELNIADNVLDIVFHAWVLISLARGVAAHSKLKKMPETETIPQPPVHTGPDLDA